MILLSTAAAILAARFLCPAVFNLLRERGLNRQNFKGKLLPRGLGLVFPLAMWPALAASFGTTVYSGLFMQLITGFSLLGFLDDVLGDSSSRGFRGHLGALKRGKLTTGMLKALGGGLLALLIVLQIEHRPWHVAADTLLIVLAANGGNLLDLRPGRLLKVFLLLAGVMLTVSPLLRVSPLLPVVGIAAVVFPWDIGEKAMLGDTGANALGGVLGLAAAIGLSWPLKWICLLVVLLLNIGSEKVSLSAVIEANTVLRLLDEWGRPDS